MTVIQQTPAARAADREFGEDVARGCAAHLLAEGRAVQAIRERAVENPRFDYMWNAIADAMDALLAEGFDGAAFAEELRGAEEASRPTPGTERVVGWERLRATADVARRMAGLPDTEPGERARLLRVAARMEDRAEADRQAGIADAMDRLDAS